MRFYIFLLTCLLNTFHLVAQTNIISFNSAWKYLDNGSDQGTAWRGAAFDDAAWKSGPGKFGYGIPDAATIVSYGSNSKAKHITTYFRKEVQVPNPTAYSSYEASVSRDDGVVVYVNGTEVYRNNMPSGTVSYTTRASSTSSGDGLTPLAFTIPVSVFTSGTNTLAIEIHQGSPTSSDIAFDLEVTGVQASPSPSPPSNQPPTVVMTSPDEGASFPFGQAIALTALASDPDNNLAKVAFYADSALLGEDHDSPYSLNWTPSAPGTYNFWARATDVADANANSAVRSVTVNSQPPPPTNTDSIPPTVLSINRYSPTTANTTKTSVTFRATFSEKVAGVDESDFALTTVTGSVAGTLAAGAVVPANSGGTSYDVTVSAITGTGKLRLDLKTTGTGITDNSANAVAGGFTTGQLYTIGLIPATTGFTTITRLDPIPISSSTGEKPQSKVWKYAGKHWAVLPNGSGTYLWRLDGTAWTSVLRLSSRTTSKADCRVVGNLAHILLFQGRASQLVSVEYDTTAQTFKLWSKRTSTVGLSFESGVEVATIDMDGTGRMWLASDGNSTVHVRWSDSPYNTWSTPYTVATGISSDDISAIIALPGKIGVLWSNQNTKRFGFKTHIDGDPPTTWSNDEVPASQSAMETGHGMADDHMNMAIATNGTLYCAVKTGYDSSDYPELVLLIRRPTGIWENVYEIAPLGTRPVVILNETEQKLRVVYTAADGGGDINYKESALAPIAFGGAKPLLVGGSYNNSTSTKENFLSDIVIMASSSTEAVSVLASVQDSSPTPSPTNKPGEPVLVMPANLNVKQPLSLTLGWRMSANTDFYQAQVSTLSDFATTVLNRSGISDTTALLDGLAGNRKYFWRVRAMNSTDTSTWSQVWSFTTNPSNSLVGHWKMDEGGGSTLLDASGFENNAVTISGPTWVPGKEGLALWLNGSSQYASVSDHETLDITDNLTLAVWVKPNRKGTQYILKKAENNVADGYELSFSSSGLFFFRINESTSDNMYRLNSKTLYPTNGNTWIHIAATFDGTSMKLYANGVLDNSMTLSSSIKIKSNDMPLYLGSQGSGAYKFEGALDDARIYKTALTAAEINGLATGSISAAASSKLRSGSVAAFTTRASHDLTAYPNPFTSKAVVNYVVPEEGYHTIKLYDSKGGLVRILREGSIKGGQLASFEVDGSTLAKGLYILRLEAVRGSKTLKLVLDK